MKETTEIKFDDISGRAFPIVTILQLQSLRSSSGEIGGVLGGLCYSKRTAKRPLFDRIQESGRVSGGTENSILTL